MYGEETNVDMGIEDNLPHIFHRHQHQHAAPIDPTNSSHHLEHQDHTSTSNTLQPPPPAYSQSQPSPNSELSESGTPFADRQFSTGTTAALPLIPHNLSPDSPVIDDDARSVASTMEASDYFQHTSKWLRMRQFGALSHKNWIIKKRNPCQSCCELLAPILFVLLLYIGYKVSLSNLTETQPMIYVDQTFPFEAIGATGVSLATSLFLGQSSAGALAGGFSLGGGSTPGLGSSSSSISSGISSASSTNIIGALFNYTGPTPLPDFDTYTGVSMALRQLINSGAAGNARQIRRSLQSLSLLTSQYYNLINTGRLAFAPDTPQVRSLVAGLNASNANFNRYFDRIFATEDEATQYSIRTNYTQDANYNPLWPYDTRTWAVLSFNELDLDNGIVDYVIRMNYSCIPPSGTLRNVYELTLDTQYQEYYYSGWLSLQHMVDDYILKQTAQSKGVYADYTTSATAGTTNPAAWRTTSYFASAPQPVAYSIGNPFYAQAGPFVGLVLTMSLLYPISRLLKALVEEKESRMKETMFIMGLRRSAYLASHLFTNLILFTIIALISVVIMKISVFSHASFSLVFVYYWLFVISMLPFTYMLSTFFNKAKLAGIVGPIIVFATVMPRFAFFTSDINDPSVLGSEWITFMFSPTACAYGADIFMQYEGANEGLMWSGISENNLNMSSVLAGLIADIIIYSLLAMYFELVIPNEYGSHRRPWFFLNPIIKPIARCFKQRKSGRALSQINPNSDDNEVSSDLDTQKDIEPVTDPTLRPSIVVSNLFKTFRQGNFWNKKRTTKAVSNLSLTMYESQITALLGHNGAGKTTTISMLTGLLPVTSGNATIEGFDLQQQKTQIREFLGVCPQQNVIYGSLTFREQMRLFAILKGVPRNVVNAAAEHMLQQVGLSGAENQQSSKGSGGMKRKLCVGMALIGGSKVVFLDEPTSGMDVYARRYTWEILRKFKQGRTIVLTTHFMEEADLLADRVAIMSSGKLRCLGSSLFLKNRFGIGYILTVVAERNSERAFAFDPDQIYSLVQSHVQSASELDRAAGSIQIRLPIASVTSFPAMFRELDARKQELNYNSYGVAMTTLDAVFLKIAQERQVDGGLTDDAQAVRSSSSSSNNSGSSVPDNYHLAAGGASSSPSDPDSPASPADMEKNATLVDMEAHDGHSTDDLAKGATVAALASNDVHVDVNSDHSGPIKRAPPTPNKWVASDDVLNRKHRVASWDVQIWELLKKRWYCAVRDVKGRFFEIILPVGVIAIVLLILIINIDPTGTTLNLNACLYTDCSQQTLITNPNDLTYQTIDKSISAITYNGVNIDGPVFTYLTAAGQGYSSDASVPVNRVNSQRQYPPAYIPGFGLTSSNSSAMGQYLLTTAKNNNRNRAAAMTFNDDLKYYNASSIAIPILTGESPATVNLTELLLASQIQRIINNNNVSQILGGNTPDINALFDGLQQNATGQYNVAVPAYIGHPAVTIQHNSTFYHAIPAYAAELTRAKFQLMYSQYASEIPSSTTVDAATIRANPPTAYYQTQSHALPLTTQEAFKRQALLAIFAALFTLIPFCYLPATFVIFTVRERRVKSKHSQLVSGVSQWTYWFATYVFDLLDYTLIIALVMIVFAGYNNKSFVGANNAGAATFLLFWCYGAAVIPFSYALSFLFVNHTAAQVAIAGIHFVLGFALLIASYIMDSIQSTQAGNAAAKPYYRLLPPYALGEGLIQLAQRPLSDAISGRTTDALSWTIVGRNLAYLGGETGAYYAVLMIIELRAIQRLWAFSRRMIQKGWHKFSPPTDDDGTSKHQTIDGQAEDEDVASERTRISAALREQNMTDDLVIIHHLRKQFPDFPITRRHPKVAVNDLSLGIPHSECFGFLGTNGAGKSTTMNMLTGDMLPTSGLGLINGYDIVLQRKSIRQQMGYCPQFDPLLDLMNAREHLYMYARLRGLTKPQATERAEMIIKHLGLGPYAANNSQGYSGGNKRKLSLGIAIIGEPKLVLLDEPSSGMDPLSRRFMWNIISELSKHMSVVLTTHSMEEAESLCNRIGIMVNGDMKVLGSTQHLKNKYGAGYELEIHSDNVHLANIQTYVQDRFDGAEMIESHFGHVRYKLPLNDDLSLAYVFECLEGTKEELGIRDYGVSQTSLEQVFLKVAKSSRYMDDATLDD